MTKSPEKTDVAVPRSRKGEQAKTSLSRVVGSKWHYVLVLIFAGLLSVGIWARPDWASSVTNLVVILGLVMSGLAMCYALTRISKNRMLALLVAVIYMSSPYLLENFCVRMSLTEAAVMVAAPILLLGLYQLTAREKHATRYLAIAMTVMILSQGVWVVIFSGVWVVYILINIDKMFNARSIWRMVLAVAVTLGLTAFFTVPMVEAWLDESGVISWEYVEDYLGGRADAQMMNEQRVQPHELVNLDYTNGGSVALGAMALIGIIGFWFAWRTVEDKGERRFVTSLYIISVLAILLTLPIVDWGSWPSVLWRVQNPAKFLLVAAAMLSVVAGYTVFALVRRVAAEKQAVFAIAMGVIAVAVVARMIMPGDEGYLANLRVMEDALSGVAVWSEEMWVEVRGMVQEGCDFSRPLDLAIVASMATAGLGGVWVVVSSVYDWYKRRKQKEVDSLIDSVWEAMAENEGLQDKESKSSKPKRTKAVKQNERILPEPPAPAVPGMTPAAQPVKKSTRTRAASTKKADDNAGSKAEKKVATGKSATKKPMTTRKATTRTKVKSEASDVEETRPRVTKVKAGAKKEV